MLRKPKQHKLQTAVKGGTKSTLPVTDAVSPSDSKIF